MLISRKVAGEAIKIGDVTIEILSIVRGKVNLGIDAPPDVKIELRWPRRRLTRRPPRR